MEGKKIWHVTTMTNTTTTTTMTTRNMRKAAVSTPREMVKVRVTLPLGTFVSVLQVLRVKRVLRVTQVLRVTRVLW